MYNGIGLTTPRGSGTNGHVQRNWAFVRPGKKDNSNYRSEEDIKKLDATLNRPPNKEILDHDRKRKIEVKCIEFEEILEKQGRTPEEIKTKIDGYRQKLMGIGKTDLPKDEFGRIAVRETHQIAEAQQEKNAKLREAFNISEYFVEGSSFDSDRKTKEDLAKSLALQKELDAQRESVAAAAASRDKEKERDDKRRYALVRTPSREKETTGGGSKEESDNETHAHISKSDKKKKKKRSRESSASPERKRDRKKKSKKHKKESKSKKKKSRKRKASESESADSEWGSDDEKASSDSEYEVKRQRKRAKKDKKKRDKKKRKERSSSVDKSCSNSPDRRSAVRVGRKYPGHRDVRPQKKSDRSSTRNASKSSIKNPFRSRSPERAATRRSPSFNSRRRNSSTEIRGRENRERDYERRSRREHDKNVRERRERRSSPTIGRSTERSRKEATKERNSHRRRDSVTSSPTVSSRRHYSRSVSRDKRSVASKRRDYTSRSSRSHSRSRSHSSRHSYRRRTPLISVTDKLCRRTITPTVQPLKGTAVSSSPTRSDSSTRKNLFNPFKIDAPTLVAPVPICELKPVTNPFKNALEAASRMASSKRSSSAASSGPCRSGRDVREGRSRSNKRTSGLSSGTTPTTERPSSVHSSHSHLDIRVERNDRKIKRERRSRDDKVANEFTKGREHSPAPQLSSPRHARRLRLQEWSRARKASPTTRRSTSRTDCETEKLRKRSSEHRRSPNERRRSCDKRDVNQKESSPKWRRSSDRRGSTLHSSPTRHNARRVSPSRRRRSSSSSPIKSPLARVEIQSPAEKCLKDVVASPAIRREEGEIEGESTQRAQSQNSTELRCSPARRNPERYRSILENMEKLQKEKETEKAKPPEVAAKKRTADEENPTPDARKMRKAPEETTNSEHEDRGGRTKERSSRDISRGRVTDRDSSRGTDRSGRQRSKDKRIKEYKRDRDRRDHRDTPSNKRTKPFIGPVVRLQGQSEDENEAEERTEKVVASLDEFQETKRGRELKDMEMLEQLKTDIAAKAKEKLKSIEKMANVVGANICNEPLVAALADSTLVDTIVSKVSTATVAAAESAARRSRSRSRRSRSRSRSRPRRDGGGARGTSRRHSTSRSRSSHYSSSSSRSRSRTRSRSHRSSRSRSHSHSSHSSCSSRSSSRSCSSSGSSGSSRTGSRSPSIPRRRGSPSFLDRRRITSARKRPIPYHRKTPSDASSFCSSCYSPGSSPHSLSRSPTRSSRSPSTAF